MEAFSTSQFHREKSDGPSINVPKYLDNGNPDPVDSDGREVEPIIEVNPDKPTTEFRSRFTDCMEMGADVETVTRYLDNHPDWFRRCAYPMEATPIGQNGYGLSLGKFGALGYDVEPRIGLDLLPGDAGVYRIQTIAVPGYTSVGYDVDFQAELSLNAVQTQGVAMTHVEWVLDLGVEIEFPRFIRALPRNMVQGTGDRLLREIVRQISRRLTRKVQEDFHASLGLTLPK